MSAREPLLERTDTHPLVAKYARHVNPGFIKLLGVFGYGRLFERAQDVWVWDHQDRKYLDFLAGYGCVNLGHNHPRLIARLKALLDEDVLAFCHVGPAPRAAELAAELASLLARPAGSRPGSTAADPLEISLFASSGAEAIEAAMKLARAATRRSGFLSCQGGYHGTSFGALSVMGHSRMRAPFEPLLEGCKLVPFGDLGKLKAALSARKIAAFVVEPIQGEGGVVIPPAGYLAAAQELCRKYGTVLILDEVQTGIGRTGSVFAFSREGFVPDVIVLAKALSGGIAPIAAAVVGRDLYQRAYGSMDRFDLHSSTFAGNAFSCAAALETLKILADERLAERSDERGGYLLRRLRVALSGHPLVKDIRGRGLFIGIEIGPTDSGWMNKLAPSLVGAVSEKVFGQWASFKLLERGILCQPASHRWNILKLEPPLTIEPAEIEQMVTAVTEVFAEYQGIGRLLLDVTDCLQTQARRGWAF
jgi:putrescine aminotransferase